jgi:hypothetical protein
MIPPHPTISLLIKSMGYLNMCLEPKVMEVEIIAQMIEPGVMCIMGINASSDVMNRGIRLGAKTSRPSGMRIRNGQGATESTA